MRCRDREVLIEGPAGTGKSRAALEKVHAAARKYPGMRGAILRKTRKSLTQSAMVTFQEKVVAPADAVRWRTQEQEYRYPNGSVIVVGGLDDPQKIMSSEYDLIYVQEATELREHDWELLDTRLRNGVMPYQQIIADCNPDAPTHWLNARCNQGKTTRIVSRHVHNPAISDEYLETLRNLTGVRRARLYEGRWAQSSGTVHEGWDAAIHVVDRFEIPDDWTRYWSVDFGFTNPFVWQAWAQDHDGRLYRYHEIYKTGTLVEDHARRMLAIAADEPRPAAVVCDHDAEGRATLERYLRLRTVPAEKGIVGGLQAVDARLRVAGDGRPRLFLLRDSLVERDARLDEAKKPCCTEEEMDSYVWKEDRAGLKEEPLKQDDHGNDALRYMVAHVDLAAGGGGGERIAFHPSLEGGNAKVAGELQFTLVRREREYDSPNGTHCHMWGDPNDARSP